MKHKYKKYSFTLIEVIIAIGISTLVIGASMIILFTSKVSIFRNEAAILAETNARTAMERITNELRLSRPFRVFISNNVSVLNNLDNGSAINFQIPVGSYDPALDLTATHLLRWGCAANEDHHIAYSINADNQLVRSTYSLDDGSDAVAAIIAPDIQSLNFNRTASSSPLINVGIIAEGRGSVENATFALQSSVTLRN
ncbi:MAG: type II secretion system protein [Candidatus Omnitrophota bacterium]|nr:MAG: type II secretion system protein [Candidatus Omnitrophota bacterium]